MICALALQLSGCACGGAPMPELDSKIHMIAEKETAQSENFMAEQNGEMSALTDSTNPEASMTSTDIAELYRDLYEQASAAKSMDSLETISAIVDRLGEYGFVAADSENKNRIDLANWEAAEAFCQQAEEGGSTSLAIFCITDTGGFIRFDLECLDGSVTVNRSVLTWKDNTPEVTWQSSYPAHNWVYTEDGYLFFDEYTPEGYDGAPSYTAIRIKPLDERCRYLNRTCIAPVGYGNNNLFLQDWTEEDFSSLDFNDLFPLLYPAVFHEPFPCEMSVDGNVWHVPETVFETVIQACFAIDVEALREQTDYDPETKSYLYTSRSFYDSTASPNLPYPEVTACVENPDQTITLTVNAVFPKEHLSQAFCHEVVVRPTEGGSYQYVSNHILDCSDFLNPDGVVPVTDLNTRLK